jgi:hypothetical protein
MSEESKMTVGVAELVKFGKHLNELHGSELNFEMMDDNRRMKTCSLDDVIASFQAFSDRKTESFKVCITFNEGRPGMMCQTTEFIRKTRI